MAHLIYILPAGHLHASDLFFDAAPLVRMAYGRSVLMVSSHWQISAGVKAARVKQVLADMALNNVSNRGVEDLTPSEYKRLVIGVQLMRDPGPYSTAGIHCRCWWGQCG